jgi:hypothetical protein
VRLDAERRQRAVGQLDHNRPRMVGSLEAGTGPRDGRPR